MGRRKNALEGMDGLQLLLDPICNTFGGVVFMALLIALLGGTHDNPQADAQATARAGLDALARVEAREKVLADARTDAGEAAARQLSLRQDIDAVAARLGWSGDRVRALALQYSGQADAVRAALDGGRALDELAKQATTKAANVVQTQARLDRQQAVARAAEQTAAAARLKNRVTLRMPAAHETTK